jgi:H+/Na+-translocating ferredoxin:NAD+ oxidoreductase subunit G
MNAKEVIKPAVVLLIIASVAAAALGVVQSVTAEPIRLQEEKNKSSFHEGSYARCWQL